MNAGNSTSTTRISRVLAALRDAGWLTRDRVSAFSRVLLVQLLVCVALIPWLAPAMKVGQDFAAFWTSARFALDGRVGDAYGEPARAAMAAVLGRGDYAPFFYPPTAIFLWLPFALLPYTAAVALWIAASGAAYAAAIGKMLKGGFLVPALAYPAVLVCALFGQNALFSAALLGAAAAAMGRSPLIAGVLIGVLTYKPQLALLAPLVLLAARRWRAFAAAAATSLLLIAGASAVFGIEAWRGFIHVLPQASAWNGGGVPGFEKFASPYAAIRLLGGSSGLAWLVQLALAAVAVVSLVALAWKRPGGAAEIALMVAATGLCVPFLGNYDMVVFAVPGAWLVSQAMAYGWLPYERVTLAALYIMPLVMIAASSKGVPLGPVAVVALNMLVIRRALLLTGAVDTGRL